MAFVCRIASCLFSCCLLSLVARFVSENGLLMIFVVYKSWVDADTGKPHLDIEISSHSLILT